MANISLTDYSSQAAEIARRQRLAEILQQQGMEPEKVFEYNGIQAPISPLSGLAKALQLGMGAYMEAKNAKKSEDLKKLSGKEFVNFMQNYDGTPEVRSDMKTVAASQPAPLAAPTAPVETINTAKPFVASGTPPQKMAQALQSSMDKGDMIANPQRIYGNAAPEAAPEAAVLAQAHTNTPQEKMAMLRQGMSSGNPYFEKFAPAMYDEASKEEKSNKIFDAVAKVKESGADPQIMEAFKAANDPAGAVKYLAERGLKAEEAAAAVAAYKIKAADTATEKEADRLARKENADQNRALTAALGFGNLQARHEAAAAAQANKHGPAMPTRVQDDLAHKGQLADSAERALTNFDDRFVGHPITGDVGVFVNRLTGTDPQAANWWQDYKNYQAEVIHDRYGGALTPGEVQRYKEYSVSPQMNPQISKNNLDLQNKIIQTALARKAQGSLALGYDPEAVTALIGRDPRSLSVAEPKSPTAGAKLVYNPKTGQLEPK
jgi:hypothetical protein